MMHFFCLAEVEYCLPEPKWNFAAFCPAAGELNAAWSGSGADRFIFAPTWTCGRKTLFTEIPGVGQHESFIVVCRPNENSYTDRL